MPNDPKQLSLFPKGVGDRFSFVRKYYLRAVAWIILTIILSCALTEFVWTYFTFDDRGYRVGWPLLRSSGLIWLMISFGLFVMSKKLRPKVAQFGWLLKLSYSLAALLFINSALRMAMSADEFEADPASTYLFIVCVLATILILWKAPGIYLSRWESRLEIKDFLTLENSLRTTLLQLLGGALVLAGIYFTAQNLSVSQENVKLTLEKAEMDRLSQATSQLKDESREVRLLAIYTLRNIAGTSADKYSMIVDILSGYVRSKTASGTVDANNVSENVSPSTDMQAAIEFLVSLPGRKGEKAEISYSIDDGQIYFSRRYTSLAASRYSVPPLDLRGADLRGANLMGANLFLPILTSAHLEHAHAEHARLLGADLRGAFLSGISLNRAELPGAKLTNADLSSADLRWAVLLNAELGGAILDGANLDNADLQGVKGLTLEQLERTSSYINAKLPEGLR